MIALSQGTRYESFMSPDDLVLVPLASGGLLVSPSRGRFMRMAPEQVPEVRAWLNGSGHIDSDLNHDIDANELLRPAKLITLGRPSVSLQLTNACNLACSYCYSDSGKLLPLELSAEQFEQIVVKIRQLLGANANVTLTGGEPLLVPWAIDVAEWVVQAGLRLTLLTNGTLIAEANRAKRLASLLRRGADIRVSISGTSPVACNAISRGERFERALAGIWALAEAGAAPAVDLVLFACDIESTLDHATKFANSLPPDIEVRVGFAHLGGRAQREHVFHSQLEQFTTLRRLGEAVGTELCITTRSPRLPRDGSACALGRRLHVRSDGALFTCHRMLGNAVGHVADSSFDELLCGTSIFAKPAHTLATCRDCPFVRLCAGGCRAENFINTADRDVPLCGPWRVQVLAELLAVGRTDALDWPVTHLVTEARRRGIEVPERLRMVLSPPLFEASSRQSLRHLPLARSTALVAGAILSACNAGPMREPTARAQASASAGDASVLGSTTNVNAPETGSQSNAPPKSSVPLVSSASPRKNAGTVRPNRWRTDTLTLGTPPARLDNGSWEE